MSEKFDMKLVIDAVTTPLLHARLSQANSYRDRAALLRSLAEAALRGDTGIRNRVDKALPSRLDHADPASLPALQPRPPVDAAPAARAESVDSTSTRLIVDDSAGFGHDAEQLADAFQAFF